MGNHHTIIVETCPDCGGDGGFESLPYGVNYHDGSPLTHWIECRACKGGGEIETEYECRTLDDLEAEEYEMLAAGTHCLNAAGKVVPKPNAAQDGSIAPEALSEGGE